MKTKTRDGGCVVTPGSAAGRYIDKAWSEGRVLPMNAAARKNSAKIYADLGIEAPEVPAELQAFFDKVTR